VPASAALLGSVFNSTTNANSYAIGSRTYTAGRSYLFGVVSTKASAAAAPSAISGTGITFTKVNESASFAGSLSVLSWWRATPASTTTTDVTVSHTSGTGCIVIPIELTDTKGGTNLVVQSGIGTVVTGTSCSATLGSAPTAGNLTLTVVGYAANSATDSSPDTNWTALTGGNHNNPSTGGRAAWSSTPEQDVSWTGTNISRVALIVEVAAAQSMTASTGTFTLAGQAATFTTGGTPAVATVELTPASATLSAPAASGSTLTAATGTFTLTGQPATLLAARRLEAAAGAFTLTGNAATLAAGGTPAVATVELTPASATLSAPASSTLIAGTGAFTLTGNAADIVQGDTPRVVTSITRSPTSASIGIGAQQTITYTVLDQFGMPMAGVPVDFGSSAPAVIASQRGLYAAKGSFVLTGRDATISQGGGGETVLFESNFASGNINPPFLTPGYPGENPTIVSDTANLFGHGTSAKILEIPYPSTPLTRAVTWQESTPATSPTYGQSWYHRGTFYIQNVPGQVATILRKLTYWTAASGTGVGGFIVTGSENGNLYIELLAGRVTISPAVPVSVGAVHSLVQRYDINSAHNVSDGRIRVWLDDVLVVDASGLRLLQGSGTPGGFADRFADIATGDQLQGTGQLAETRWWDDDISVSRIT
jgi:hypothetical protein